MINVELLNMMSRKRHGVEKQDKPLSGVTMIILKKPRAKYRTRASIEMEKRKWKSRAIDWEKIKKYGS